MTTGDKTKLLQQQTTVSFTTNSGTNPSTITLTPGTTYQSVDALGFCFTEGSAEVISGMAAAQQDQLMNDLFNASSGIGISAIRISIAASDLSSSNYSYDETAGDVNMTNFSLAGPDLTYLIPLIKKALQINPALKILATPWSPPRWMKTNNAWVGGSLNTSYYAAYANYFVKYFQAMQAQGISIWAITPQNEPENPNNNPSMLMNSTEEKNFINNNLGPAMAAAGFGGIKIIAFDHNCDNTAYPIDVCNNSSYVDGAAFHLYAGSISALTTVKNATNKNVYFTEQFTGSNGSFSGDFGWHLQNVVTGSINNWSKAVFEWNVANNAAIGPYTQGGCNTCLGAYTINSSTSYTRNVSYYIIGQLSKFVKAGAVRINSGSSASTLYATALKNPDGSIVLLAYNGAASASTIKVLSGSQAFNYTIPAASAVTFVWGAGTTPPVPVTGVSVSPTSATVVGSGSTQLTATVSPANATNQNVSWSSSNTSVATVNQSGLVTGVSAGTATITVTTQDGARTATSLITVTGQQPYTSAVALPGLVQAENFDKGGQNIAYNDADATNNGGQYRPSEGVDIANIGGTTGYTVGWTADGEWLEYTVNVTAGTYTVLATVATPSSGKQLVVKLDGATLATINIPNTGGYGNFQTVSVPNIVFAGGSNKILRLEIVGGDFNIDNVEVRSVATVAVTGVTVSPISVSLATGGTTQLTATVSPSDATNKSVTWTSSNTGIATVSSTGLVTGVAAGTATITVKTVDGNKTAASTITVTSAPPTSFPGYYNVIARSSGKGLDVADNSTSSGARLQQYDITNGGGNNQRWSFVSAGAGKYYVKVKSTQMCMAPSGTGGTNGEKVQQRTCTANSEFQWTLTDVGNGYYKILNGNSGKALDVQDNSTANGADIQLWDYAGGTNQQWRLVQVETSTGMRVGVTEAVVKEVQEEKEISTAAYPNPAKDFVWVLGSGTGLNRLELCAASGEVLIRTSFVAKTKLNIASLAPGIYLVRVSTGKGSRYIKLLKN
jgi:glucosylceramidase